jgi:hypothetical protein
MNYKNIQSTFVFNQLKDVVLDSIQGSLREGKVLSNVELEEQMMLIKKYINSAIKPKVMNDYEQGLIRLIYAPESVKRVSSVPYVMSIIDGRMVANVFVSSFGNMRQDGMVSLDYRKLYVLMESAYLSKTFLSKYDRYKNTGASIYGCVTYANMFVKPLNKKFNIHTDRTRENSILFLAAKFYLKNVLGLQNEEMVFNNAMKACKAPNPIILKEIDNLMDEEAFRDLGTFLEALKDEKLNLGLSGLTARGYLELYIGLYGGASVFALEMMPYFIFVGNSSLNAMGIVNNYSLEDIMEKGMPKLLGQFYM